MDRRISVDLFKKGDFLRRSSQHNDQKSVYDHYLNTDRLLEETKRFVNELRDGNDKMLASKKRSDLEARVCDIAAADMAFIFAEKNIHTFVQNRSRTNLRRRETRADNDMSQIDLLKCTAFLAYQTFYWLHRDFNAEKKETLIHFLANKGLRLPPHLELELHTDMLALRRRAQRDPWNYISETRKRNPLTDEKTGSKTTERKLPVPPVPPVILLNETKSSENIAENHLNERGAGRNPLDVTMGGKEPTNAIPGPGKSLKAKDHSLKNTISLEKYLIDESKALEDSPPKSKGKRKRIIMGVKHLKAMTGSGMEKESSVTTEHLAPEDPPKSKGKRKGIVMGVKHLKMMVESKAQKESAETNAHPSKEAGEMDKEENSSLETDDVVSEELPNERMTEKKKEIPLKADDGSNKNPPKVETVRNDKEDSEAKSIKRDDELHETDTLENPTKTVEKRKRVIMGVKHLKTTMESKVGKETSTANGHVSKEALRKDEKEQKSLETDDVTLANPLLSKENRQTIIMGVKQLEEMMGRRMEKESSEANENDEQTGSNDESAKENSTTSMDVKKEKLPMERLHIQTKVKFRWRKKNKNKDENIPKEKKTKKHPIRSAIRNFCVSVFDRLVAALR